MSDVFPRIRKFMCVLAVGIGMIPAANSVAIDDPADWTRDAMIPKTGRPNPYQLDDTARVAATELGRAHALHYPVDITGVAIPYATLKRFFESKPHSWLEKIRDFLGRDKIIGVPIWEDMDHMYSWMGLHRYPVESDRGVYSVPYPKGVRPSYRMGATMREDGNLTFSCAACHSGTLFGKSVLGMTNRFPRANEIYILGRSAIKNIPKAILDLIAESDDEAKSFKRTRENLFHVESVQPQVLGLDTSLAHTALSLSHRKKDAYASKTWFNSRFPRREPLRKRVADSKPAPWWTAKYKTRWLLDGSVVSGNPIYTNILWNEIGRGTDLVELESWLESNLDVIAELTTAVFGTESPKWTDFFPAESIDLRKAQRGQRLFNQTCAKCHGEYDKGWNSKDADALSLLEKLETTSVIYHDQTPVMNVGTDPLRAQGMQSLVQLNDLEISQRKGIVIEPQEGYIPPPLVGIWARWPYFHNNSAPSLCAVLTRSQDRPRTYFAGEPINPKTDFDSECVGYPLAKNAPKAWKIKKGNDQYSFFDTRKEGMSNRGHDEGIFLKDGQEIFTPYEKLEIIEFLKTL